MEKLYQDYKDIAEFCLVYISEAHAMDDKHPVGYAKELGITEHKTFGERCTTAGRLMKDKKLTIPCLVDNMDGAVEKAYKAWPDRIFVVGSDGKLAVAARRGPWGFKPALKSATKWLSEFRKTGREPPPVLKEEETDEADGQGHQEMIGKLTQKLMELSQAGKHEEALKVALEALQHAKAGQKEGGLGAGGMLALTNYNAACMYSLLKRKDKAFEHLEAAIAAGGLGRDMAGQIKEDGDFANLRDDPRYAKILENAGGRTED